MFKFSVRQERSLGQRFVAAHVACRGRFVFHQVGAFEAISRPGGDVSNGALAGRPSMGSWLHYGLGSENSDLPAFIVLVSWAAGIRWTNRSRPPVGSSSCHAIPGREVPLRRRSGAVPSNPDGMSARHDAASSTTAQIESTEANRPATRNRHAHRPVQLATPHANQFRN